MSASAISAVSPIVSSDATALVKTANGEYSAASVDAHPAQAAGLVKLKDGNYGAPIVAASDRYTGIATDLSGLKRGG